MKKIRNDMLKTFYWDRVTELGWSRHHLVKSLFNLVKVIFLYRQKMCQIYRNEYTYVRQVEFVLTTKCSLRCRDCANLMQYYKKPYEVEKVKIINALRNLLDKVDELDTVVLVGGEPFLAQNFKFIIEEIKKEKKINHINIYTNGTIIPKDEIISALVSPKVKIIISDYGDISRNKKALVEVCNKKGVDCYLKTKDLFWGDVGNMEVRKRTSKQLVKQFRQCKNPCRSILNGKLYYCPRASHGDDLGLVKTSEKEYVDLMQENLRKEDILKIIYSQHYFSACDYCNYGTKDMVPITPGVQLLADKHF